MKNKYIIGGIVTVIGFYALAFSINKAYFLNLWVQWLPMLVYAFFMYQACVADIAENGVARDFRAIVRTPFTVFLLINLAYWLFYYGLHLADPELVRLELQHQLADIQAQLSAPLDVQRRQQLMQFQTDIEHEISTPMPQPIGPIISRMAIGALGGFAIAAAIAAILKSRN